MGFVQFGIWHDRFKTHHQILNIPQLCYYTIPSCNIQCIMYSFPTSFPIQVYKNPINIQMFHHILSFSHPTPLKINGWNLRIQAPCFQGKSSEPNHHVFRFQLLIFMSIPPKKNTTTTSEPRKKSGVPYFP